ncbi:MAG: thiaminase II [Rickettsiales bacterium]|nr:thiaminase II [Rickettsiales bacterium]
MLSKKAWNKTASVITAIKNHPFNQELMSGKLAKNKFAYYIEQDAIYLKEFARCHTIIASRISIKHSHKFIKFAEDTFKAEQELVHQYFRKIFKFKETGLLTPATLSYTSYLLRMCSIEPVEIAVAAILPCFWLYREVGLSIAINSHVNNPYNRWIETYSSDEFSQSVDQAIEIFNYLGKNTTQKIQQKMIEAFYKSSVLEWHFWNDAYYKNIFDNLDHNTIQCDEVKV